MSNRINSLPGSRPTSPIGGADPRSPSLANFPITFLETFEFPHKKLTIKEEQQHAENVQETEFYQILCKLFLEILQSRIDIVPTQPADAGSYAVEAFFRPAPNVGARSTIHLPLPIRALGKKVLKAPSGEHLSGEFTEFVRGYVEKIISNFALEQVLRLIIVASHEYGHYQSFVRGNHDENLKRGLYIFQKKYQHLANVDEFTWLVFREECQAWNYAEIFLKKTTFSYWDMYEEVKNHSLKTYFENLNLNSASLETFYKLSFLGDDFKNNSLSQLFTCS
jgi:hypothetical protein